MWSFNDTWSKGTNVSALSGITSNSSLSADQAGRVYGMVNADGGVQLNAWAWQPESQVFKEIGSVNTEIG